MRYNYIVKRKEEIDLENSRQYDRSANEDEIGECRFFQPEYEFHTGINLLFGGNGATNTTFRRRKSYLQYRKYYDVVELHIVDTSVEECIERNRSRDRSVPVAAIYDMYNHMQDADYDALLEEGYDDVRMVSI